MAQVNVSISAKLYRMACDDGLEEHLNQLAARCSALEERLIIRPIRLLTSAAMRFGAGDLSARSVQNGLPPEFAPLAQAFNGMATRLAERERELMNANSQLSVLTPEPGRAM